MAAPAHAFDQPVQVIHMEMADGTHWEFRRSSDRKGWDARSTIGDGRWGPVSVDPEFTDALVLLSVAEAIAAGDREDSLRARGG